MFKIKCYEVYKFKIVKTTFVDFYVLNEYNHLLFHCGSFKYALAFCHALTFPTDFCVE